MKTKDMQVLARQYNIHADGYLLLARGQKQQRHYLVAWQSRHSDIIDEYTDFTTKKEAAAVFNKMAAAQELPAHSKILDKDWQQQSVYDWEETFILPHSAPLNEDQARQLIARVAQDHGMPAPKLEWQPYSNNSAYNADDHCILFGHRNTATLLHEIAHALHLEKIDHEDSAPHAPGFVWTAIALYHNYAGFDLHYLITSAAAKGLLGDLDAPQIVQPKGALPS